MSNAEVITTAIVAVRFFSGNFENARHFLKEHGYIPNMLSKSRLNRLLPKHIHAVTSKGFELKVTLFACAAGFSVLVPIVQG